MEKLFNDIQSYERQGDVTIDNAQELDSFLIMV